MKIFFRLVVLNIILGHIIAISSPFSFSKPMKDIQTGEAILFIWIGLTIICGLFWWGSMFYHWGISEFNNKTTKKIYFWILLFGTILYLIGPLVYYIVVFEMGKGLKAKERPAESIS